MKKFFGILLCVVLSLASFSTLAACGSKYDVVIYSSMDATRNDKLKDMLTSKFPDLKVNIQFYASGTSAAKVKTEGAKIEADIVLDLDYGYLESLKDNFADLTNVTDTSVYVDSLVPADKKYIPLAKFSVGMIVNEAALKDKPVPQTYDDLTKADYKNLISMPSPSASGTGYGFLKGMIELKGEDAAFAYFDGLSQNIRQFTTSGSGPVNNLVLGECAIGLGMVFQAVEQINKGVDLKIITPAEGLPYNLSGGAVIKGRETNENVKKVFEFFANDFLVYDKLNFLPEQIFKSQEDSNIANYPKFNNIEMNGFDPAEKERLLAKWKY